MGKVLATAAVAAVACAVASGAAVAQGDVAQFFAGRTINLQIGTGSGGGYDLDGRVTSRHLGRFIPGNPTIVPQNIVGARGLTSINRLYAVVARDGTAMGVVQRGLLAAPWVNPQGVQYDPAKMNWLFSTAAEPGVAWLWHTSKNFDLKDIRQTEVVVGGAGDSSVIPQVFNYTTGSKFKLVTGYKGSADVVLAIQRGEVEGIGYYSWSNIVNKQPDWIRDKKVRVLVQTGSKRAADLPEVPTVSELASSPAMRQVQDLWLAPLEFARPYVMPPDVPTARVEAVRAAFEKMIGDPEYRADMAKSGLTIDASPAHEIMALLERFQKTPQDVIELARKAAVDTGG